MHIGVSPRRFRNPAAKSWLARVGPDSNRGRSQPGSRSARGVALAYVRRNGQCGPCAARDLDGLSEPSCSDHRAGASRSKEVVSEGLTFYAEGDYQRAASWLWLVALATPHLSAAADFALADMYERGYGVPQDVRRAYALYLHAGSFDRRQLRSAAVGAGSPRPPDTAELAADDDVRPQCWQCAAFATDSCPNGCRPPVAVFWRSRPTTWRSRMPPTLHEQEWGQFTWCSSGSSMHCPASAGPGQRDLLEVLFCVTSAKGAGFGRTLTWRVLCRRSRRDRPSRARPHCSSQAVFWCCSPHRWLKS